MNELHAILRSHNVTWPLAAEFATQNRDGGVVFSKQRPIRRSGQPIWNHPRYSKVGFASPTRLSSRWYSNIVTKEQWEREQWIEWTEVDRHKGVMPVPKGTIVDVLFNDGSQSLGGSAGTRRTDANHVVGIDPTTNQRGTRIAHYWGNSAAFRIVGYRVSNVKPLDVQPEWIEWTMDDRSSDVMPVPRGTLIDVEFTDGQISIGVSAGTDGMASDHVAGVTPSGSPSYRTAGYWGSHTSNPIVRYRLHTPSADVKKPAAPIDRGVVVAESSYEPWNTPACKSVSEEEFSISATMQHIRNLELAANEKLEQSAKLFAEAETLTKERLDLLAQLNVHLAELNLVVDFKDK